MRRLLVLGIVPLMLVFAPAASTAGATTQAASAPKVHGVITFTKNHAHPDRSELRWRLLRLVAGTWTVVDEKSWRAGSGMLGERGRNACVRNVGWLPDGSYHLRAYLDYQGRLIKGRAFRLDDKGCGHGVVRHQLFIHTEQGAHDSQCRDRRGDQVCRWEYPRINDYKSHGCIKVAPRDLADLMAHFRAAFRPGVRYPTTRVVLRVVG